MFIPRVFWGYTCLLGLRRFHKTNFWCTVVKCICVCLERRRKRGRETETKTDREGEREIWCQSVMHGRQKSQCFVEVLLQIDDKQWWIQGLSKGGQNGQGSWVALWVKLPGSGGFLKTTFWLITALLDITKTDFLWIYWHFFKILITKGGGGLGSLGLL